MRFDANGAAPAVNAAVAAPSVISTANAAPHTAYFLYCLLIPPPCPFLGLQGSPTHPPNSYSFAVSTHIPCGDERLDRRGHRRSDRNPDVGELSEPGVDAVNRLPRVDRLLDDAATLHQRAPGLRFQADAHAGAVGNAEDVIDRERLAVEDVGWWGHRPKLTQSPPRFNPCSLGAGWLSQLPVVRFTTSSSGFPGSV